MGTLFYYFQANIADSPGLFPRAEWQKELSYFVFKIDNILYLVICYISVERTPNDLIIPVQIY